MVLAEQLPHATCPVCRGMIAYWSESDFVELCRRCCRPLFLVPVRMRPCRIYRIVNLLDVVRSVCAGLALGVLIAFATRTLPLAIVALISASVFALQGMADVVDGFAGSRTNYVRNWGRLHVGHKARRASIFKCAIGMALLLLAMTGLSLALA